MPPFGPCRDTFMNLTLRPVEYILFIGVCVCGKSSRLQWPKLKLLPTQRSEGRSSSSGQPPWASLHLIGANQVQTGSCETKPAFPIKPYFFRCSRWVKLSLWFVHIISGKQDPKHDLCAGLHHVAPPENRFRQHIVRNRSRQADLSVFRIKTTLIPQQSCISQNAPDF